MKLPISLEFFPPKTPEGAAKLRVARQALYELKPEFNNFSRPSDLGLSDATYAEAVLHAREIRDRTTFLDFAADTGVLPRLLGAAAVPAQ